MTPRPARWLGLDAGAAGLLLGGALFMGWRDARAPAPPHALRPDDATLLAVGQRVYTAHCASCHGASGEGQHNWRERNATGLLPAPPHDPSGHTWHHPDEQLFAITKLGLPRVINQPDYKTAMPAYEGVLSDEEIVAVLSWIKSRWPADARAKHDAINAQAREAAR